MLAAYGIERALATHSWSEEHSALLGNEAMRAEAERRPVFTPCAVLLPSETEELPIGRRAERLGEYLASVGARAARLLPSKHGYLLTDTVCGELFGALAELRIPVSLSLGEVPWERIDEVLTRHPRLRVIVERVGYRHDRTVLPLLAAHRGLHVETSSHQSHEILEVIRERYGPHRSVFGTDYPFLDPAPSIARVLYSGLDDEAKADVAHRNLDRLLEGADLP